MNKEIEITPKDIAKAIYDLLDKIEELEDKYENAVADYEYEKYKNKQAIEILKLCNSKCSKEVIEILTGDKKE